MINNKHKKVPRILNYTENLFILAFSVNRCVSVYAFNPLVGIPVCIASSAAAIKICVITERIQKYKSIIKKKKKKHNKTVFLAKTKLNNVEVLISKALIDSNIIHDEFVLVNNVLKEYGDMKK